MRATFVSTKRLDFKPVNNDENILLQHLKDITGDKLALVENDGQLSLIVTEPENIKLDDVLTGRIIKLNFPKAITSVVESHKIMSMNDGSYIECSVLFPEEEIEIPEIKWEETGETGEGTKQVKCTCGKVMDIADSMSLDDASLTTEHEEEHKTLYLESLENSKGEESDEEVEERESYIQTMPEGYVSDPLAPNGYRPCRPGHRHGVIYKDLSGKCCNGYIDPALLNRTIVVRLVSETLGEVVLYSLVGVDDLRINTELYKVNTAKEMRVEEINRDSIFYHSFKI